MYMWLQVLNAATSKDPAQIVQIHIVTTAIRSSTQLRLRLVLPLINKPHCYLYSDVLLA